MVVVVGLAAMWIALSVTVAEVLGRRAPDVALAAAPFHAGSLAYKANLMLSGVQGRDALGEPERLAVRSLRRDPTSVEAVRVLGVIATMRNEIGTAERAFRYADMLTRRDLVSRLWWIEREVQAGNVTGALRHFDTALRTSRGAKAILFPILISASDDPEIAAEVNKLLRQKPFWWRALLPQLFSQSKEPETIRRLTRGVLDPAVEDDRALIRQLLDLEIALGRPDIAWDIYREAMSRLGRRVEANLVDGGFEEQALFPPFGWKLVQDADLAAVRQKHPGPGDDVGLYLSSRNGRGGAVASQLIMLTPGRYRLSAMAGNVSGYTLGRPTVTVSCADGDQKLISLPFPLADDAGRRFTGDFSVPRGCSAQWARVELRLNATDDAWIDSLAITKI